MKHVVDARGLACPLPVVNTKDELTRMQPGETVEVLVDNEIAVQNLAKFARVKQHAITSEQLAAQEYRVVLTKGNAPEAEGESAEPELAACDVPAVPQSTGTVVVLSSNQMGQGEAELGRTLMKAFVFALTKQDQLPQTILMYNTGAFLSCEGSDSVEDLRVLANKGVEILTCGTCLNYYQLTDKLVVGGVTNMYDIVEKQEKAARIIRP
jgi:selenium metabolism protein YedF